jgi:hypothetical protein
MLSGKISDFEFRVSKRKAFAYLVIALCAPAFFYFSMFLLVPYVDGDQFFYRNYYYFVESATIWEAFSNSQRLLGAIDVTYPAIIYVGAQAGIDKDVYISLFNTLFLCLIVAGGMKYKVGPVFIFLALTNFYGIVLLTGAERLKFSFILLLFVPLFSGVPRFITLVLAPLTHFQTLILYFSIWPHFFALPRRTIRLNLVVWKIGLGALFLSLTAVLMLLFGNRLASAAMRYSERLSGLENLTQIVLLSTIAMVVLNDRIRVLSTLVILSAFVIVLGGSRVNMMAFFYFVCVAVIQGRANHPLVLLLMTYFSLRSLEFIENILVRGNGFDWGG